MAIELLSSAIMARPRRAGGSFNCDEYVQSELPSELPCEPSQASTGAQPIYRNSRYWPPAELNPGSQAGLELIDTKVLDSGSSSSNTGPTRFLAQRFTFDRHRKTRQLQLPAELSACQDSEANNLYRNAHQLCLGKAPVSRSCAGSAIEVQHEPNNCIQ